MAVEPSVMSYFISHIEKTNKLYENIQKSIMKTYEINDELIKEPKSTQRRASLPDESENFLLNESYIPKKISFAEDNFLKNSEAKKFSFSFNKWEVKNGFSNRESISLSTRNHLLAAGEINPKTPNNNPSVKYDIKQIFSEHDYNSFLNLKLNGFREYFTKKSSYLNQEKKTKHEVFSYLFDQNISKTKNKKIMQIRLKNIADIIKKKHLKNSTNLEKPEEENSKNIEKPYMILDFFKKQEQTLNQIRKKINKVFIEESKIYNNLDRSKSIASILEKEK